MMNYYGLVERAGRSFSNQFNLLSAEVFPGPKAGSI